MSARVGCPRTANHRALVRDPFFGPRDSRSSRTIPAPQPQGPLYSRFLPTAGASFYLRAGTTKCQAAQMEQGPLSYGLTTANEGAAMAHFPSCSTARSRFNPASFGRIAGSVAAQRTYKQGLAASGPDGTRVLMPPVARIAPGLDSGRRALHQMKETFGLHPGPSGPPRIAFGERKNDMSSRTNPYGAAAHKGTCPSSRFKNALGLSAKARTVSGTHGHDDIRRVSGSSLAALGG